MAKVRYKVRMGGVQTRDDVSVLQKFSLAKEARSGAIPLYGRIGYTPVFVGWARSNSKEDIQEAERHARDKGYDYVFSGERAVYTLRELDPVYINRRVHEANARALRGLNNTLSNRQKARRTSSEMKKKERQKQAVLEARMSRSRSVFRSRNNAS